MIPLIGALGSILIHEKIGSKETVVDFYQYAMVVMLIFFVVAYLIMFTKFAVNMWRTKYGKQIKVDAAIVTANSYHTNDALDIAVTDITINGVRVDSRRVEMPYDSHAKPELTLHNVHLPNFARVVNCELIQNVKWNITCAYRDDCLERRK